MATGAFLQFKRIAPGTGTLSPMVGGERLLSAGFNPARVLCAVFVTMLFVCIAPVPSFSAGFDCAKAKNGIEKAICIDADLSRQDRWLQETYQKLLTESVEPEKLKSEQRAWMKERDRCGGGEPDRTICLSLAYYARRGQLETELFLKRKNTAESATEATRYPDMWLSRFEDDRSFVWLPEIDGVTPIRVFKLDKALQQKLGMSGRVDDYFFLDALPAGMKDGFGKFLLRGFFSGEFLPVAPTDSRNLSFVSNQGVAIDGRFAVSPLPNSTKSRQAAIAPLPDGTMLRHKLTFLWNFGGENNPGPAPCERGTWTLERVDASAVVLWSHIYLLDASPRWTATCGALWDPADNTKESVEEQYKRVAFSWDEYVSAPVYLLDDGTVLIPSSVYILRLRLSDGQFGRMGIGAAVIDPAELMAIKLKYKPLWERRENDALRNVIKCFGTDVRKVTSGEYEMLRRTKCRNESEDPARNPDNMFLDLNDEIERTFLYPRNEQGEAGKMKQ